MKSVYQLCQMPEYESPPSRGAWIEMYRLASALMLSESPPSRGAWIEMEDQKEFDKIW